MFLGLGGGTETIDERLWLSLLTAATEIGRRPKIHARQTYGAAPVWRVVPKVIINVPLGSRQTRRRRRKVVVDPSMAFFEVGWEEGTFERDL